MPRVSTDAIDKSQPNPMQQINNVPTITCGVQRKAFIGNFETVDIFCSVTLPVPEGSGLTMEELKPFLEQVAQEGFSMVSKETGDRYELIKEAVKQR
jgi:hypothetical protein